MEAAKDQTSFEEALAKLESIVESMESGDVPLADLIARSPDGNQPPLSKQPERAEVRGNEIHIVSM